MKTKPKTRSRKANRSRRDALDLVVARRRLRRKAKGIPSDDFIRSLRGSMKGSGALQFLLAERRRDNARDK